MLIIENISGVTLDINDLGLSLDPNQSVDLTVEGEPQAVAASGKVGGDLNGYIASGNIVVKDPLDGVTNLTAAQGIIAASTHNDTHYRMPPAGRIADAIDVDLTANGTYLRYNGTTFERRTPAQLADEIESEIDYSNIQGSHGPEIIENGNGSIRVDPIGFIYVVASGQTAAEWLSNQLNIYTSVSMSGGSPLILSGSSGGSYVNVDVYDSSPAYQIGSDANGLGAWNANNLYLNAGGTRVMTTTNALFEINTDDIKFGEYPNTRDDGATSKALYVDVDGNLKYGTVSVPVSHADLTDLTTGDPHTQYVKKVGDTMTGDLTFDGNSGTGTPDSNIILMNGATLNALATGGQIVASAGTIARPGVAVGDLNSGLYLPSNNNLSIVSGGVAQIELSNTASPQIKLNGTTIQLTDYVSTRDDGSTSKALYVDASGNLQYGDVAGSSTAAGGVSKILNTWTLLSGTLYYNDFVHNLGTTNVSMHLRETSNDRLVYPEYTEIVDANTVRTVVEGNAENLTINIVSGSGPAGPAGADGIVDIVEDLTPQLGGTLDMNSNSILAGTATISPTELSHLDGVTSSIQTQINSKTTASGHTHVYRIPHTWGISGSITIASGQVGYLLPMFIGLATGQSAKLVKCQYRINGGTSATLKLQRNGVDIPSWNGMVATTSSTTLDTTDVTLSDEDRINLVVTAVAGSPQNLSFTMFVEYTQ